MLREYFGKWGEAKEVTSTRVKVLTSPTMADFFAEWGINHRAKKKAEEALKSTKHLILGNIGPRGSLDTNTFMQALLEHRNTFKQDTVLSPAMVFGRRYILLTPVQWSHLRQGWKPEADLCERAHRKQHTCTEEKQTMKT